MELSLISRFRNAWNVFRNKDPVRGANFVSGSYYRPDRIRLSRGNERTIVTSVYNRIATDAATIAINHVRLDENGRFKELIDSGLNNCLTLSANLDQSGRLFLFDAYMSMMDEGCVALVPVDTDEDIRKDISPGSFDILSLRVAKIVNWYPQHVTVRVYNEKIGRKQDVTIPKTACAIVENPFYSVMNEPNSTLQRLIRKLSLLDTLDENNSSGKLDLIIQLPYVVKTPTKREQADQRRKDIERQLSGSKYGIAYTDGTEKITQLNRPVDNTLMSQVEYLTSMLYSQLGLTQAIMDGTADDSAMMNYYSRTIEPIVSAIVDEMKRKFLSQTARSRGQSIMFFRDPFKLVPVNTLAEIADKMTRNCIMSANEIRQILGMKPSDDPKADELRNANMPDQDQSEEPSFEDTPVSELEEEEIQNE